MEAGDLDEDYLEEGRGRLKEERSSRRKKKDAEMMARRT